MSRFLIYIEKNPQNPNCFIIRKWKSILNNKNVLAIIHSNELQLQLSRWTNLKPNMKWKKSDKRTTRSLILLINSSSQESELYYLVVNFK